MRVRQERTGFRDESISKRHRDWGFDVPATDIDFLMIEYDYGSPKGLIEYKNENANVDFNKLTDNGAAPQSYKAIKLLADKSKIPFLVVIYTTDLTQYFVIPMNDYAKKYVSKETLLSETQYVELLYKIRGRFMPQKIIEGIQNRT